MTNYCTSESFVSAEFQGSSSWAAISKSTNKTSPLGRRAERPFVNCMACWHVVLLIPPDCGKEEGAGCLAFVKKRSTGKGDALLAEQISLGVAVKIAMQHPRAGKEKKYLAALVY